MTTEDGQGPLVGFNATLDSSGRKRIPNPIDVRSDVHAVCMSFGQHDRRGNTSRKAYPISKTIIDGTVVAAQHFLGELPTAPHYQIGKIPRGISEVCVSPIKDSGELTGVRLNDEIPWTQGCVDQTKRPIISSDRQRDARKPVERRIDGRL